MAITNGIFKFYALQFNGVQFSGPKYLGGVSTSAVNPNPEVVQDFVDGNPYPSLTSLRGFAEQLSFTTLNIDTAIDLLGASGACIEDGSSVEVYYAKYSPCTTGPDAGSVHRKVTISQTGAIGGLISVNSLNVDHRGDATMSFQVKPQALNGNSAITVTPNVALPAGAIDNKNRYTIGPVDISGTTIDGIQNISVDFGVSVESYAADSSLYEEFQSIDQVATKVSMAGINPTWFDSANLGMTGAAATHADTSIVLRRRLKSEAGYELNTSASHIVLTAAGLAVPTNVASTSGTSPVESGLDLYAEHDGTNVPLVALTGQTY